MSGQTWIDLAFETCQFSRIVNHDIVDELIEGNKVLRKAKNENIAIKFGHPGEIKNFQNSVL